MSFLEKSDLKSLRSKKSQIKIRLIFNVNEENINNKINKKDTKLSKTYLKILFVTSVY